MENLLTEFYSLMVQNNDGDYELCFDEENHQLVAQTYAGAFDLREEHQEHFDLPIVIIRETQTLISDCLIKKG